MLRARIGRLVIAIGMSLGLASAIVTTVEVGSSPEGQVLVFCLIFAAVFALSGACFHIMDHGMRRIAADYLSTTNPTYTLIGRVLYEPFIVRDDSSGERSRRQP